MGYKRIISNLNPTVKWGPCTKLDCSVKGLDMRSGRLLVPSNYREPFKRKFSLYVERYSKPNSRPKVHVIILVGGPGYIGKEEMQNAIGLVNDYNGKVAAYLVDHRGLGDSGRFLLEESVSYASFDALTETFKNSAFNVRDLIMTNAALDVAMLGIAVRKSTIPSARLVLRGFSYGAQWAHHVIQLMPDLFASAFLGGVPLISGVEDKYSLIGLAEVCAKDEFCRQKMGGDVYASMNAAVWNLGNKDYNECTRLFHESRCCNLMGTVGERTRAISGILYELLTNASKSLEEGDHFRPQQLLLPFLMATEKCINTAEYHAKVLRPILETLSLQKSDDHTDSEGDDYRNDSNGSSRDGRDNNFSKTDNVVNPVILLDVDYQDFSKGAPEPLSDHTDLHPDVFYSKLYYKRWKPLRPFLAGRELSEECPIITHKTDIYIMASRLDLNTTYMPAWSLFKAIAAPTKKWLLFDNRGHYDGYWGECFDYFEWEALFGKSSGFDFEMCVRRTDAKYKLDWTFSKYQKYSKMWDCVPDSNDLEGPQTTLLPTSLEIGNPGVCTSLPFELYRKYHPSSNNSLIILMATIFLLKILI